MLLHIVSQGTMLVAHPSRALQSQDRWAIVICYSTVASRSTIRLQCSTSHAPGRKLIAQLQSGRQLAIRFHKYRANAIQRCLPRGYVSSFECFRKAKEPDFDFKLVAWLTTIVLHSE